MNHRQNLALQVKNLELQVEMLQRRNNELRANLERQRLGEQPAWTPFERAVVSVAGNGRMLVDDGLEIWVNSRYQVTRFSDSDDWCHLSIKRIDGAAVHDWRDFQRIKNEIVGPEAEAVELYPAESRLVDGANQYHLFCTIGQRFPFGFGERLVSQENSHGVQQRPWPDDQRPSDLSTMDDEQIANLHKARVE